MLQQTQARRVVDAFLRWVELFPDAPACARAGVASSLQAWAGLGYNGRAVRLHRAAVIITETHGGVVPDEIGTLEALPGVGPYTARAVMVFAFGAPLGVLDTNTARVICRAVAGVPLGRRECQALADRLVPVDQPWAYNQTLFDIGVAHCRSRSPRCDDCPLRPDCTWARSGWAAPDPAGVRPRPERFVGSDRQGRGRLVEAMRRGPIAAEDLAQRSGWPADPIRARRVAERLVFDGVARWNPDGSLSLP